MRKRVIGLPAGFRDILFEEAKARRTIENRMAAVFDERGFNEILPSGVESIELYARGNQSVLDRAFRFLDRNDNLLALRADFTPAVARIAASRLTESALPIRVWYSGDVFRKVEAHHRGYAEFAQIGAELIGPGSVAGDAEILGVALECLTAAGLNDVRVHINHAGVFRGIVDALGLEGKELRTVKSEIDRKDARGIASRLESLGVSAGLREEVNAVITSVGPSEVLDRARRSIRNDVSRRALDHLSALAESLGPWADRLVFDLAEMDEMEYYTGIMTAFLSPKLNRVLGTGGRYDALVKEFGWDVPAVGFSLSLDALVELL